MIGKRGTAATQAVMGTLQELFIVLIISFVFITVAVQTGNSESLQKNYLVKALAMTSTLVQGVPGQLQLNYSPRGYGLSSYDYVWKDSLLFLDTASQPATHPFLWNQYLFPGGELAVTTKRSLYFQNDLSTFNVSSDLLLLSNLLSCPEISYSPGSIFIDIAHGLRGGLESAYTGYTSGSYVESEQLCDIATLLSEELSTDYKLYSSRPFIGQSINCQNTERRDPLAITSDIENSELVISLHMANSSKPYVKAYVALNDYFQEAQSIACKALNRLQQAFPDQIESIMILPDNGHFSILGTDKPAIVFELGSLNSQKTQAMLGNKGRIAAAIAGGLE